MIFKRLMMAFLSFMRGLHDVIEDAVNAEPDPEVLFVGLDMDIRRVLLDGVHEDEVHQLDDRGVLGFGGFRRFF